MSASLNLATIGLGQRDPGGTFRDHVRIEFLAFLIAGPHSAIFDQIAQTVKADEPIDRRSLIHVSDHFNRTLDIRQHAPLRRFLGVDDGAVGIDDEQRPD